MKRARHMSEAPKFLSGWKEIAGYLGKGVRTVQRYEREDGLPVRRPASKSRPAVIATRAEVDAWVAAGAIREQFVLSKMNAKAAALEDIRKNLETMGALRAQMQSLRSELRSSVSALHRSIEGICIDWKNRWFIDVRRHSPEVFEALEPEEYEFPLPGKVV
ncbi:MAG TPA: hypothetical protein VMU61_17080 [Candidatus Aquilonibacter sp.]|nr:hypothetical protein [Candidatus Aquilonibacter sp.]